jgi:DNA-binding NarL/FixJ family response regulator
MEAGAQAYLTKPCDMDGLVQTIKLLIGKDATQADVKRARLQKREVLNTPARALRLDYSVTISVTDYQERNMKNIDRMYLVVLDRKAPPMQMVWLSEREEQRTMQLAATLPKSGGAGSNQAQR